MSQKCAETAKSMTSMQPLYRATLLSTTFWILFVSSMCFKSSANLQTYMPYTRVEGYVLLLAYTYFRSQNHSKDTTLIIWPEIIHLCTLHSPIRLFTVVQVRVEGRRGREKHISCHKEHKSLSKRHLLKKNILHNFYHYSLSSVLYLLLLHAQTTTVRPS